MVSGSTTCADWECALRNIFRDTPDVEIEVFDTHRADHRVGLVRAQDEGSFFFKIFAADSTDGFETEVGVYRQLRGSGIAPELVHVDEGARLLVLELAGPTRLCDLDAEEIRGHLEAIPALYSGLVGLRGPRRPKDRVGTMRDGCTVLAAEVEGLPEAESVLAILDEMAEAPVHGDFQPSNLLASPSTLLAIDFESYGWDIPALDVARTAYNPLLPIALHEREELAKEMLARVAARTEIQTSSRQFAAACVYWAVECGAYFAGVAGDADREVPWYDQATILASEPLQFARDLWNRER